MKKRYFLPFVFILFAAVASGSSGNHAFRFESNKGQWPTAVKYKCDIPSGRVFLESTRFTYVFYSEQDLARCHPAEDGSGPGLEEINARTVRCHAYRVNFLGSAATSINGNGLLPGYLNYFIGQDPSKWASHVPFYGKVSYASLYPGVDMQVYNSDERLKVDFIVAPHSDAGRIRFAYEGLNALVLENGNLRLQTSVAEIVEQKPFAYQVVDGKVREVSCRYKLEDGVVSFEILSPYKTSFPLVIDPVIVASTYSGSHSKTYGHCATYDVSGNIFTGGRCFGSQYPVTVGAFDMSFGGGVDIAISKLNADGSGLVYATYLGGASDEYAHSLFVDNNDDLFIYGSTTSADYPVTRGCFHSSLSGLFSDIVVSHLSADGSSLIGSTFVGGSAADGRNSITVNMGDELKGDINVDLAGNIYVASFTMSSDFPVTPGCFDPTLNGDQDAVVFCLNNSCSHMIWATYLGGDSADAAYSLKLKHSGEIVISGSTKSRDFPTTSGAYQGAYNGGARDGWVARLYNNVLLSSSYFGSDRDDEAFFVETDASNNVFLLGQTNASLAITPGLFGSPGGRTFIASLNSVLSSLRFQTLLGNDSSDFGLAPTAFMVDVCGNIYLSGFGHVAGYPVTTDAFYPTDSIGSFYIAKLSSGVDSLLFGSFYGGFHVDGGTSRFDRNGIMYQAVCQAGPGFPTQPNAYATTTTQSWDICVFKADFENNGVHAKAHISPSTFGCQPYTVNFSNLSHGTGFTWYFGDGSPADTNRSPVHLFADTGDFEVTMIVVDSATCNFSDTLHLLIRVREPLPHVALNDTLLCGQPMIRLESPLSSHDLTYCWQNGSTQPSIPVDTTGYYWVRIANVSCSTVDSFYVHDLLLESLGPDTMICIGQPVTLQAHGNATSYLWSNGATSSSITASTSGFYWVAATLQECTKRDSIAISTVQGPVADLGKDTILCPGTVPSVELHAGNHGYSTLWSTGDTSQVITANALGNYWVRLYDGYCYDYDTMRISEAQLQVVPRDSVFFCDFVHAILDADVSPATYLWSTGEHTRTIQAQKDGTYWFQVTYNGSCIESDTFVVSGDFGQDILYVPNAFTPNGDGVNDFFVPVGTDLVLFELQIFNRWGKELYTTYNGDTGWDGRTDGKRVPMGVYIYKIAYSTRCSDGRQEKTGCVLVTE